MKKYFIFSDCHGFYKELEQALNKAGFDINNQEHCIIFCGDALDRGSQSLEIINFLKSLPKDRRVLIRGNHELLLQELVTRKFPDKSDKYNGTYDTLFNIVGLKSASEYNHQFYKAIFKKNVTYGSNEYTKIRQEYLEKEKQIYTGVVVDYLDWVFSNEWVNYYETNNYIFVHSFIPVKQEITNYGLYINEIGYREDWRNATQTEWNDAMWGCPWSKAKEGWNKTGKTIVCGHWHTSDFFNNLTTKQHKQSNQNPIFKSKRYKLIGLDACTVITHKINILVMNEDEL